jgi:hypothetical protein
MRVRPAQVLRVYPRGWGGSLSGLGQCTDPSSGETVDCPIDLGYGSTPVSPVVVNPPISPLPTSAGGGLTAQQLAAIIQAGTQSTLGITRALSTPSLTPGTNVIYNPATGQFYNPQTGQVVSPGGTGGVPLYATASVISPGVIIGLVVVGGLLLMSMRK